MIQLFYYLDIKSSIPTTAPHNLPQNNLLNTRKIQNLKVIKYFKLYKKKIISLVKQ